MSRDSRPRLRGLRALLSLFPKEFRVAHQHDMEQVFREQHRDARQMGGRRGTIALWFATLADTMRTAPTEHLRILAADAAYALRRFRHSPGMTAVAVATIAIGIGATTAVYSLVDHILLRPLPYAEPDRLVHLRPLLDGEESMSGPVYRDLEREVDAFDGVLTMAGLGSTTISGTEGPERVRRLVVSANFFDVLGTPPLVGRTFRPDDVQYLSADVLRTAAPEELPISPVVISHNLWQRRFGGTRDILQQRLKITDRPFEIIGVLPDDFRVLMPRLMNLDAKRDLWWLSNWDPESFPRDVHYLEVLARLAPGVSLPQAQAAVDAFCARQRTQHPELAALDYRIRIEPLHRQVVGHAAQSLWTLFGAVVFVLLIACANVASIMLAGGATRQGELGLRVALGASRERLVRQLMTESALIATAGTALGVALAFALLHVFMMFRPEGLQRFEGATLDAAMLRFALLATVVSTLLFGTVPSLRYAQPRLQQALAAGRRSIGGLLRRRSRGLLVAAEIALCFVLVAGTGLLVRTFVTQLAHDPGFAPQGVATTQIMVPRGYPDREDRIALYRRLAEQAASIPGVESTGLTTKFPFNGGGGHTVIASDQAPEDEQLIWDARITPGYFRTLGIPLHAGRLPTWSDMADPDRPFALVDTALAQRLWPDQEAVGRQLKVPRLSFDGDGDVPNQDYWAEVIGVVGRVHDGSATAPGPETVYLGLNFTPSMTPTLVVRSRGAATLAPALRTALLEVDDQIASSPPRTMAAWIGDATAELRFTMILLGIFGLIGLLLAAVGLYALLAHAVRRGTGEIGLRLALGAEPKGLLTIVLAQGMKLTALGLVLGLVGAVVLGRVLAGSLFGIPAHDPLILGFVGALLTLTALAACLVPALRAVRVDPIDALREA